MKKTISVLLSLVLVFSLAACGNAPESSAPQPGSNTSSTAELTFFEQGKKCFENEDWIGAIDAFKAVNFHDEEYKEAQEWLEKTNTEYAKMVIAEVEARVQTDSPINVINYIVQSQKIAYLPELIEELDHQYELYTNELTEEASKLYDEGRTVEAMKVFDDAYTKTGFVQIPDAKEAFLKTKAVYLMKDIEPFQKSPLVGVLGDEGFEKVNDSRGYTPEVMAFGLKEDGKVSLRFDLDGQYSRLRGTVFIPQTCKEVYSNASVKIIVEGTEVFSRTKLKTGFVAADFDISVENRRKVIIEIVGGSNKDETNYPWVGDAYVIK
jgi:uncharacterized lipoprotein YehR (DUF1307 family)